MLNIFTKLSTLEVEEGGTHYSSKDNTIYNAFGDMILFAAMDMAGEYKVPIGVTGIGPMAFAYRSGLTKLTIPAYVTSIGNSAFLDCSSITQVTFEGSRNNNLTIGSGAFVGCGSINSVTFGGKAGGLDKGTITIGESAFEGLKMLGSVVFEPGVNIASIGDYAFAGSERMHTLTYSEGAYIGAIGNRAFENCSALPEAVIPTTIDSIGEGAFSGCYYLRR